ncbi:MAG TPA: DUF4097 family beta strand repeat-containing protein [Pseudonocardia sp.]
MTGHLSPRWTTAASRSFASVACLVACALGCLGCQPVQVNSSSGDSGQSSSQSGGGGHVDTNSYQISQRVDQLRLDGNAGAVKLTAADGPITVTETARYSDDKPVTSHTVDGTTLTLTAQECQRVRSINGRCEVEWEIHAPAGTNVTLRNGAGDITVTGFAGPVDARTSSGGVRGRQLTAKTVTAKSEAGDVELSFTQPPDQVDASSSAGDVEIKLPGGVGYDVRAHTSTGEPEVNVRQQDDSPHKIEAKTSAGSVQIDNG